MIDDELGNGQRRKSPTGELAQEVVGEARDDLWSGEPAPANANDQPEQTWKELMEEVVAPENIAKAMRKVRGNRGSPGVDGMTVDELADHWQRNESLLRTQLLAGTYRPTAVRRVTIPKSDGGERELGIPTVTDRLVQQAIAQVLGPRYEAGFSSHTPRAQRS